MEEEKQTLYALYRDQFKGILPDSLMYSLFDFDENNIFNTMETAVYDGEKLVSFSFFDLGENSIASINGVYHPDYARYSLGFYTMLLEIQFGIENDFKFFYPGYVAPGYPRFDYKLRIAHPGQIEYYEIRTRDWQPYLSLNSQKNLVVLIIGNLLQLLQHDSFSHFDTNLVYFPDLDISGLTQDLSRYLETPIFISFNRYNFDEPKFLVTYDIWNKSFVFLHLEKPERITGYILKANNSNEETLILLEHLRSQNVIVQTPDLEVIAKWVVIWDRIMKENFIDGSPVIQ
jgi:arginine-tRNA-protein transferase